MNDWISDLKKKQEQEKERREKEAARRWEQGRGERERQQARNEVNRRLRKEVYEKIKVHIERIRELGPDTQVQIAGDDYSWTLSNQVKIGSYEPNTIDAVLSFSPKDDGMKLEFKKYFSYYRKSAKKRGWTEYYSYSELTDERILALLKWVAMKDAPLPNKSGCKPALAVIGIVLLLIIIVKSCG
jgi:hypothetical protein